LIAVLLGVAIALMVSVAPTVIGPVYLVELLVGGDPFVV
jgi:hypothetical protein